MLRWLFERLDTTPGQEKVIARSFDVLSEAAGELRSTFARSRAQLASAVRGEELSHAALAEAWVGQDAALEKARTTLTTELDQVHEALDARQREILARLLEEGPGAFRGFGARDDGPDGAGGGGPEEGERGGTKGT